jgi:hypothetical protein
MSEYLPIIAIFSPIIAIITAIGGVFAFSARRDEQIKQLRVDVDELYQHKSNFATKEDIQLIRSDIHELKTDIRGLRK